MELQNCHLSEQLRRPLVAADAVAMRVRRLGQRVPAVIEVSPEFMAGVRSYASLYAGRPVESFTWHGRPLVEVVDAAA